MAKQKEGTKENSRVKNTGKNLVSQDESLSETDNRRLKRIDEIVTACIQNHIKEIASVSIDVDLIDTDKNNRVKIDKGWEEFQILKKSIAKDGLINPPIVYLSDDRSRIVCLSGHLRLAAVKEIGLKSVNCKYIHEPTKDKLKRMQLLENIARKNIHPIELADSLVEMESAGLTPEEISSESSVHLQTVRNYLNIGRWSKDVKNVIYSNMSRYANKAKALQKAGWNSKKNALTDKEIIDLLEQIIKPTERSGAYSKKVEKARNILKDEEFNDIQMDAIYRFMKRYDGINLTDIN
ncbi:MAG: ParB/RepB/Spo0J family partition protein [Ekhidna sp.]